MSRSKRSQNVIMQGSGLKPFYITECPSCHKIYWRLNPVMHITCKFCGARYLTTDSREQHPEPREETQTLQEVT